MFKEFRVFQKAATLIFCIFMGLMILVTFTAYSRKSGHTGLDMGKVQQMRYDAAKKSQEKIAQQ